MSGEATDLTLVARETPEGPLYFFLEQDEVWLDMGDSAEGFEKLAKQYGKKSKDVNIETIRQHVSSEMQAYDKKTTPDHVKKLGADLRRYLLPERLFNRLQDITDAADSDRVPVLRVCCSAALDLIPWELIYYGGGFLGLRFQVARVPIVSGAKDAPYSGQKTCTVSQIYNLLGEEVLTVPANRARWDETFSFESNGSHLTPPDPQSYPSPVNSHPKVEVWAEAMEKGDIVHMTCYGDVDKQFHGGYELVENVWTLKRGGGPEYEIRGWTLDDLGNVLKHRGNKPPLVFANICTPPELGWQVPSFSRILFSLGVGGYVGTLGLVYKEVAVEFACRFYRKLLVTENGSEPRTQAQALWETKKEFWDEWQADQKWDASWLFYCLYGKPDMCYKLGP
jgi:hypothetical protein